MTTRDKDARDPSEEEPEEEHMPDVSWEQYLEIREDWHSEVIGNKVPLRGWDAIRIFEGEFGDRDYLLKGDPGEKVKEADKEEASHATHPDEDSETAASANDSDTVELLAGGAGQKSPINRSGENFGANNVWKKLEKFCVICTVPHITSGYVVENDQRKKSRGDREIVIKVPAMINFWEEDIHDPDLFPPDDSDVVRILHYLETHWDAYDSTESEDDSDNLRLEVDPKGALVYAVAGRHMRLDSPSVVFEEIKPEETDYGHCLSIEGELTGRNMEITDELGLELELTALLRLFTMTACLPKRMYNRLTGNVGRVESALSPSDEIEVDVIPFEDENRIWFQTSFGPDRLGGDRK